MMHQGICGLIKAIEYFPDGSVKRVEFKSPVDYPQAKPICTTLPPWGPATSIASWQ